MYEDWENQDKTNHSEDLYTGSSDGGNNPNSISLSSFVNGDKNKKKKFKDTLKDLTDQEKTRQILKKAGKIALLCVLVGVITVSLVVGVAVVWLANEDAKGTFDMTEDLETSLDFSTTVYVLDESGTNFVEHQRIHGEYNRIWVDLDKIPIDLQNAFIAIEDQHFRSHDGVDWKRTFSAFVNEFLPISSSRFGGSTITQQLVKNLTGDRDQTAMRKVREIMRARNLEANYHKDSILVWYLNTVSMANGMYGVEVASNYYFDKSVSELNLTECAALASIVKGPEIYRPDTKVENNTNRRKLVLRAMLDEKYITKEQYDAAVAEPLVVTAKQESIKTSAINSYFVDTLFEDVVEVLMEEYGYDRSYAESNFYNGGYKIYSTMIPSVQDAIEVVYEDPQYFAAPKSKITEGVTPESAITIMDYNGNIVGIAGGKGEKTTNRGLNRATSSPRQPGSTMKPLGAYALAIEENKLHFSSFVPDSQIDFTSNPTIGKKWPKNWDSSYKGKTSLSYAIYNSVNTTPIHVLKDMLGDGSDNYSYTNPGLIKSYDFLTKRLGFSNLTEKDLNFSSLGLGGCVTGITTEQSAAAYAIFGNLGNYYQPTTYYYITDQNGKIIADNRNRLPSIAIGEDTAVVMNNLLQTVTKSGATGSDAKASGFPIYAKTGTSSESYDLWFVGGTPYYIGSCWYGFDQNEDMVGYFPDGRRVSRAAQKIWSDIMTKIHADLPKKEFPTSSYAVNLEYCTETGLIASGGCAKKAMGWYKTTNIPETCNQHAGAAVDGTVSGTDGDTSTTETSSVASSSEATSSQ